MDWSKADGNAHRTAGLRIRQRTGRRMDALSVDAPAPEAAASVPRCSSTSERSLRNASGGTTFHSRKSQRLAPRPACVVARSISGRVTRTRRRESVRQVHQAIDPNRCEPKRTSFLLPEGITVVGTGNIDPDVAGAHSRPDHRAAGRGRARKERIHRGRHLRARRRRHL